MDVPVAATNTTKAVDAIAKDADAGITKVAAVMPETKDVDVGAITVST